ncbi:UDP-3-O-(3-hydroxymyristoyl)glucosamine N-acyltransferase [Thiohalocapsa marina]|uniref:UDP-3-O-acylglucosamine N-acyltransferase n=1 Tax=Thiohalocapsa marina TaxID=424902 RepID=A0A5M8FM64_9GAMM|nr:UDP-3-O-(3-hydroxymyristoyl)glucosamine N-acyltransferase [Thiohalocapsa marina]
MILASEIAERIGAELRGEDRPLERVAPLDDADAGCLSFLAAAKYRASLSDTRAGAVILAPAQAEGAPGTVLVVDNPYLGFARAAALLHPPRRAPAGVHASAVVDADARIDPTASIGALCVIEGGVEIGAEVEIGPGCIVRAGTRIGAGSRLVARVTVCEDTVIGERALLHPGAVIGRDGFGFAKDGRRWVRIPQVGRVRLGNDVEVGANSAVDRGAIGETVIEDGVKIDNLIQIGHNVSVGENTAMAACSGISGSTRIGRNCTIGGAVGMAGHLEIGDDVHFTGMAMVTRSFPEAGLYSSGVPAMANADWRRNAARFRHLDELARRVKRLEAALEPAAADGDAPEPSGDA